MENNSKFTNNIIETVGTVAQTWIYPFKGMQGIQLPAITLRSVSVVGDRTRKLDIVGTTETPTFLDTIKFRHLLQYHPQLLDPSNPKTTALIVHTPEGQQLDADGEELLAELESRSGKRLTVVRMGRGGYHSMPISLIGLPSIKAVEQKYGSLIDSRRFRMNLYIEPTSGAAYEEENWLGKMITFSDRDDSASIVAIKKDERCATINLHPETGEPDPNVLKALVQAHGNTLGIYCTIVKEGTIKQGDPIYIRKLL